MDYFEPAFEAGGPIVSIRNLAAALGGKFDFHVLTRDRDIRAQVPLSGIVAGRWNARTNCSVRYLSPAQRNPVTISRIIRQVNPAFYYLSSLFSPVFTVQLLVLRKVHLIANQPVLLAPRGELAESALGLKAGRKSAFLSAARKIGLYRDVVWQASTEMEAGQIRRFRDGHGCPADRVFVAQDMVASAVHVAATRGPRTPLRVLFLSRISPMKNLEGAIAAMSAVRRPAHFHIAGPRPDAAYWSRCEQALGSLPPHVSVSVEQAIHSERVHEVMGAAHLLLLPSLGENFGHVVPEALSVGTPVLTSDRTPWSAWADGDGLRIHPVDDVAGMAAWIDTVAAMTDDEYERARRAASALGTSVRDGTSAASANVEMLSFMSALGAASSTAELTR